MLQGGAHRLRLQRQDHALSAHDQRREDRARGARQGRDVDRHLESARRAARSPHGDVQPEEARAGDHRVHRSRRAGRAGGAQALVDVAATRTPTRWSTCSARSTIRPCRIPSGSIDPARDAQAMEDELILADLGVAERRLERLEKDLKKAQVGGARTRARRRHALPGGARRRARRCARSTCRATISSGCAAFSSSRPSRCCS